MVELLLVGRTGGVRRKEGLIMAEYTLPDLDYDYGALDPSISGKIGRAHV